MAAAFLSVLATFTTACSAPTSGQNTDGASVVADRARPPVRAPGTTPTTAAPATTAPPVTSAPTTTPPTTVAPTVPSNPPRAIVPATTRYLSPAALTPTNGDGSVGSPWNDICYALGHVRTGDLLVVAGTRATPYDLDVTPTASSSACSITPTVTDVTVWGSGDPLVKGELIVRGAVRWTFDNLDATRSTNMGHGDLVKMIGGTGWRWTNCDIWGSQAYANFTVGHWGGVIPPTDFRIDHCFIHDNPGWAAGGHTWDQDHNLYVFTVDGVDARGVIEDNVFVGAPWGVNVKIGGTGNSSNEGSDGITLRRNVLVNSRSDGAELNVCTDSDNVTVSNNIFVSQATSLQAVNVKLGAFSGSDLALNDNLFWGFNPAETHPRPIMWSSGGGTYDLINLNQSSSHLTQARSIRSNPGYGPLSTANSRSTFGSVVLNGITYGPTS